MANFTDILDRPASEVERPKPIPAGTYTAMVSMNPQPEFGESNQKKTPFVKFTLQILAPGDDVDSDALSEVKGGVQGKTLTNTLYLTEDSVWRLKDFLGHVGVLDESKSLRQMIGEAPGNQCGIEVGHRASQDGTSIFAEIKRTFTV